MSARTSEKHGKHVTLGLWFPRHIIDTDAERLRISEQVFPVVEIIHKHIFVLVDIDDEKFEHSASHTRITIKHRDSTLVNENFKYKKMIHGHIFV